MTLALDPQAVLDELAGFAARLERGVERIAAAGAPVLGATPRETVHREDGLTLYRYRPRVERPLATPLLLAYALVNRPTMTDLQPDRSLVRGLLEAGIDVWLIDWGYPTDADRFLTLEDYVCGYLHRCIGRLRSACGVEAVNLLGICQGGVLSLCYAALYPERVRNLVTMVTPVDFHTPDNALTHLVRPLDVDLLVDTCGNVPGSLLNASFLALNPYRLAMHKYVQLAELTGDAAALDNFLRMEHWIFDSPDQAGEAFREFAKAFFQQNRLVTGGFALAGRPVELRRLTMPLLNVYATQDHLVPPAASKALAGLHGSGDYTEIAFAGGHIGIYVSGRAQREVPPAIAAWLRERP